LSAEFEKLLQAELDRLPYEKHVDDGQYNDGVQTGFELGARWAHERFVLCTCTAPMIRGVDPEYCPICQKDLK